MIAKYKTIVSNSSRTIKLKDIDYSKIIFDFLVKNNIIVNIIESEKMKHGDSIHNREFILKKRYALYLSFQYENEGPINIILYDNKTNKNVYYIYGYMTSKDPDSDPNNKKDIDYRYMKMAFSQYVFRIDTNAYKVDKEGNIICV